MDEKGLGQKKKTKSKVKTEKIRQEKNPARPVHYGGAFFLDNQKPNSDFNPKDLQENKKDKDEEKDFLAVPASPVYYE